MVCFPPAREIGWGTAANRHIGALSSLKNVKKDVLEMKKGSECGLGFQDWTDFKVGDLVQSYEEKQEKRYL